MDETESKTVKIHLPCPDCGSSNALSLYDDGHTYCFSCETYVTKDQERSEVIEMEAHRKPAKDILWSERNISSAVKDYYDVVASDAQVKFPYHDKAGVRKAAKIRSAGKSFSTEGDFKECTLFGMHTLNKAGAVKSSTVIVTEGEADALAAFQMANSISPKAASISKRGNAIVPAVSIKNGAASAERDFKNHLEFLERFDRVFICFDSDGAGEKPVERCAKLLRPGKAYIVKLEHKDPCEYSKRGLGQEFVAHLKDAVCYTPAGICNAASNFDGLWSEQNQSSIDFPWPKLQAKTLGTRAREIVTWAAGTGVGKSSILRELQHHYLSNTDSNMGIIALEESVDRTRRGILAVEANDRLHLNEVFAKYSKEEIRKHFDNTLGTGRVFIYDHFGSLEMADLLNRVRYMVQGLDCQIIFIDHLSILVSGLEITDERKAIDRTMTMLRQITEETGCSIHLVTHLRRLGSDKSHEEGVEVNLGHLRGSHGIAQISDSVVSLERNTQSDDPVECNTTTVRVLKCRYTGDVGVVDRLFYDKITGRMSVSKQEF
jgi:twinkle protein